MTTPRSDGGGTPFDAWFRKLPDAHSRLHAINLTDVDYIFHRYKVAGDRKTQLVMFVELKTFGAKMSHVQQETLGIFNQSMKDKGCNHRTFVNDAGYPILVKNFGVYVLELAGAIPEDGTKMRWGMFVGHTMEVDWKAIDTADEVGELLTFRRFPNLPNKVVDLDREDLGFVNCMEASCSSSRLVSAVPNR